jgi:hypothetical protein
MDNNSPRWDHPNFGDQLGGWLVIAKEPVAHWQYDWARILLHLGVLLLQLVSVAIPTMETSYSLYA